MPGMLNDQFGVQEEAQAGMPQEDFMGQDPNSGAMLPPEPGVTTDEDMGRPDPSMKFDVDRNPQDMQMMTDAAAYASMLKGMDEEQRKEQWPGMVEKLGQVNPKAKEMFDPSLPPSDADLDAVMGKMPESKEVPQEEKPINLKPEDIKFHDPNSPEFMEQNEKMLAHLNNTGWGGDSLEDKQEKIRIDLQSKGKRPIFKEGSTEIVRFEQIDGYNPAKPIPADTAAKRAAMETLQPALHKYQNLIFDKETGKMNKELLWKAYAIRNSGDKGSISRDLTKMAVDPKANDIEVVNEQIRTTFAYAISGATFKEGESRDFAEPFIIYKGDSSEAAVQKMLNLKMFTSRYISLTSTDKDKVKAEVEFYNERAKTYLIEHREQWVNDAKELYPNQDIETLNDAFNKMVLTDPKFIDKMSKYAKEKKFGE